MGDSRIPRRDVRLHADKRQWDVVTTFQYPPFQKLNHGRLGVDPVQALRADWVAVEAVRLNAGCPRCYSIAFTGTLEGGMAMRLLSTAVKLTPYLTPKPFGCRLNPSSRGQCTGTSLA